MANVVDFYVMDTEGSPNADLSVSRRDFLENKITVLSRIEMFGAGGTGNNDDLKGVMAFTTNTTGIRESEPVERMRIHTNGYVGIGTAEPKTPLHIPEQGLQIGTTSISANNFHVVSDFTGNSRGLRIFNGNYGSGTHLLTVLVNGSIGIGTPEPKEKLEINGSIRGNQSGALRISTGYGYVDVGPQNTGWSHFQTDRPRYYFDKEIRVDSGMIGSYNEDLFLLTSGTERIRIKSSDGNVGIGTTNPQGKLSVMETVLGLSTGLQISSHHTPGVVAGAIINAFDDGGVTVRGLTLQSNGGNVGIGTTNPRAKLDVDNGWITPQSNVITDTVANAGITWYTPAPNIYGIYRTAGAWTANTYQQLRINFDTGIQLSAGTGAGTGYEKSYVEVVSGKGLMVTSGNVGIGTTNPQGKLSVMQTVAGLSTGLQISSHHTPGVVAGAIINAFDDGGVTVRGLTLQSNGGNVGIGTTNPGYKLDVAGDIRAQNAWLRTTGNTGWYSDTYGGGWYMIDSAWIRGYNGKSLWMGSGLIGGDGGLTIGYGGAGSPSGGAIIAGKVGIGTNNPAYSLDVNGKARVSSLTFTGDLQLQVADTTRIAVTTNQGTINFSPGNLHLTHPYLSGAQFVIGWNQSGGRGETVFYQHGGAGWRSGYDFWTQRDGVGKQLQARIEDTGNFNIRGGFGSLSDVREKTKVQPISNALKKILNLRGVYFNWLDKDARDSKTHLGLIAQEVKKVVPEVVAGGINEMGEEELLSLHYDGLIPLVIEALKEQQQNIDALSSARSGSDFAEYFLSADGKAIKPGTSVVLEKDAIRPAKKGEVPIGVISVNPGLLGGAYLEWPGKYIKDDFGAMIMEEYKEEIMVQKKEKVKRERQKMEKKVAKEETTYTEIVFRNGKYRQVEKKEKMKGEVEMPVFKEVNLYDKNGKEVVGKHRISVMETYEEETDVFDEKGMPVMVGTGKFEKKTRPKLNPEYDETKEYVSRDKRPEWNCVGLIGQLPLRKGQPVALTWMKVKDISDKVELWLVK